MSEEPILDPEVEIYDAHHHLWDHEPAYLPADLRADLASGHRVTHTVYMECGSHYRAGGPIEMRPVGETEWLMSLPHDEGTVAGIVGHADLCLGSAVEDVIEAHLIAGLGRFRGIRHMTAWHSDPAVRHPVPTMAPNVLERPEFGRGLEVLSRLGLSFDAWVFHPQLGEVVAMARRHPELAVVVDHLGGPLLVGPYFGRRDEVWADLRSSLSELATCENVVLKLGGIGMPMFGTELGPTGQKITSAELARTWSSLVAWCIAEFGADRCMFESNFPVDKECVDYLTLWNSFKIMAAEASPSERDMLFSGTCKRIYKL